MRYLTILTACLAGNVFAGDTALDNEASGIVAPFASELQATVKSAMQSGGPVAAVNACHTLAPSIANKHSTGNWKVGRTSLKVRNPGNAPDEWEKQVLLRFERDKKAGVPFEQLRYGEKVGNEYRYMQAIGTGDVCLTCHGKQVTPEVQTIIHQKYPDDQATGFSLGDLRGAFTLRKQL